MPVTTRRRQAQSSESKPGPSVAKGTSAIVPADEKAAGEGATSSSSDSGSGSTDSESNVSDSESDSGSEDLDALFEKSLAALQERDQARPPTLDDKFEDNEDKIGLGGQGDADVPKAEKEARAQRKERRKVDGGLPAKELDSAFARLQRGEELGDAKPKSVRRQQQERREQRVKTAGSGWFDMPAFPGAADPKGKGGSLTKPSGGHGDARGPTAEEMRREVQAIRLRNAIDPKRFYRGSAGQDTEMPKYAQLGRIVSSHAQPAATLNRAERGKTVIDELVKDAEASAYAKRKFSEVRWLAMACFTLQPFLTHASPSTTATR